MYVSNCAIGAIGSLYVHKTKKRMKNEKIYTKCTTEIRKEKENNCHDCM